MNHITDSIHRIYLMFLEYQRNRELRCKLRFKTCLGSSLSSSTDGLWDSEQNTDLFQHLCFFLYKMRIKIFSYYMSVRMANML